jgi:pimeloyl-ACP methyl ester carboxylesterase
VNGARPDSRHLLAAAALAAVIAILAGCANRSTGSDAARQQQGAAPPSAPAQPSTGNSTGNSGPAASTTQDPAPPAPVWEPCEEQYQCATVSVPLDHDQPGGATIELALIRLPATGQPMGSIFINPGGPGASGVDHVRQGFRLDSDTMAAYDLIGFDPRGIGASNPLSCQLDRSQGPLPDSSPDDAGEQQALDGEAEQLARSCQQLDADLLDHLDTGSVARDLDLLRQAVGDERLHYYGFSFGTLIGLVYADLFADRVGHLVLDGVVDPTASVADLLSQQAAAFEQAFVKLDEACGTDLDCPPGGIATTYDQLAAELEATGPVGEVGTTELEYASLIALYDRQLWPVYASALAAAAGGDFTTVEALSDALGGTVSFAAYAAVVCSDSPRPDGPEGWDRLAADLTAIAPRFGASVANELRACAFWPVDGAAARAPVVAGGSEPILVIGNTNDPATPLENAEVVAGHLERSSLVIFDADRHTAYSASGCVQRLVSDYFVDDRLPAATVSC